MFSGGNPALLGPFKPAEPEAGKTESGILWWKRPFKPAEQEAGKTESGILRAGTRRRSEHGHTHSPALSLHPSFLDLTEYMQEVSQRPRLSVVVTSCV